MEEDTEYTKLAVEERCVHKLWKARVHGYEEAIKIFREIDDEKSNEWNKFVSLIKKFVTDSHPMAQEKGLEATLIFVENCGHAAKIVGDVMSGIVSKCISAQKTKTREISIQITLMFIEIEKQEAVVEELIKGMEHKNPKIVTACTATLNQALKEFGSKVISIKPLIKKISVLLNDRDKGVRDEGKLITIEIFRWIGPALKPHLSSLAPVVIIELEGEFDKLKTNKAEALRFLKSQQEKKIKAYSVTNEEQDVEEDDCQQVEVDPMDLIDPVEILSKLPKDFYVKLEAKKWQERKEALEALEVLLQNPKLESGDYGELIKALKKVLAKDSNVVLVAMSGKCIAGLAKGLNKKCSSHIMTCVPAILEKFKEKKSNVVIALRDAIDAIYVCTTLEVMLEELLEALSNKNPNVKSETALFLARVFTKTLPAVLNKKLLKGLTVALLKTLNESDPIVRDASAEALGTAMKLLGEKSIGPYLIDVDPLKIAKIKECSDKAVITVKVSEIREKNTVNRHKETVKPIPKEVKTSVRPASNNATKKQTIKSVAASNNEVIKSTSSTNVMQNEREISMEEIDEMSAEILSTTILSQLVDANWKTRLSAVELFNETLEKLDPKTGLSQCLIKTVCKKPGLKDTNLQVLKVKLEIILKIISSFGISPTTAEHIINDICEKLSDVKNNASSGNALTAIAEAISLEYVVLRVLGFAFEQKSPKVQMEALNWIGKSIKEFGLQVKPKLMVDNLKKAIQSTNSLVRQAAISLLGVMSLYIGNTLLMYFDSEKATLKQQIEAEFEKNSGVKPPAPIKGLKNKNTNNVIEVENRETADDEQHVVATETMPRVDISSYITESLLIEMSDKNWKNRNEGLIKLQGILNDAKLIKSNIGDLPQALHSRLVDSNAKIAQTALAICQQLAEAMGPSCRQYIRVLFPGFLNALGDGKSFIRTASITCINTWGEQCGYKEFFESEMISDALKSGSPPLRTELWAWLAEKLPIIPVKSISKEELFACLSFLYSNICDRNVDVRKNANDAILGFMMHLSYEAMVKYLEKQKPTSKKDILLALDKMRPNLPMKPLPKSKQIPIIEESKLLKNTHGKIQKGITSSKNNPVVSRKKEEEIDLSPLLAVNNLKNQRLLDEQKLKVLKWSFTTPRDEFTDLLRDQMTSAAVNKGLIANMFHDDFRYHLKAIEALLEDLPNNSKALISNLDLILKWISLRFYDTNPSVLLKGLEYLNLVFPMLVENEYILAENEGSCFIPHLLIKIGDPKDTVRNGVRNLFRQICYVYPFTKVFSNIMEGLKSKNARQRTECLDELGYLIETYGISVCQPSPQAALKEVARHIADRDNSVRSAALNCVVQAYFLIGEKVYKLIGQLNEKDLSMLDERIKRAKKNRKTTEIQNCSPPIKQEFINIEEENDTVIEEIPQVVESPASDNTKSFEPSPPKPQQSSGPFKLNPLITAEIEKDWIRSDQLYKQMGLDNIRDCDISFLYSPIKIVEKFGVSYPADKLQELISSSYQHKQHPIPFNKLTMSPPQQHASAYTSPSTVSNLAENLPKADPNLIRIINSIASPDSITARAALNELNDILDSPDKQAALRDYEEMYIDNIHIQFKNLSQIPLSESLILYQPVLASTYSFFTSKSLGKNIGIESLKKMVAVLLALMADNKLTNGDDGQYTKVINGICLKILDRTNFTNLNCALIRLLKETCLSAGLPKFTDLLMKCIWRNVKVMPEKKQELNYDVVLSEINDFMTALPSAWWTQRPSDTPLRTVKTIIHNMAKIKGSGILLHLNKIPAQSELHTYLIKVLKNVQKENQNTVSGNMSSPQYSNTGTKMNKDQRISKQTHEAMSQIFKLISDKESSKEGILKLYEFKKQNVDVDVTQFFKGANPIFQKYIEDGLAEIEQMYKKSEMTGYIADNTSLTKNKQDPDYWIEQLKYLKNKANISSYDNC